MGVGWVGAGSIGWVFIVGREGRSLDVALVWFGAAVPALQRNGWDKGLLSTELGK